MSKPTISLPFTRSIVADVNQIDHASEKAVERLINYMKFVREHEIRFNHDAIVQAFQKKAVEFLEHGNHVISLESLLAHITAEKARWAVVSAAEEGTDAACCRNCFREAEMHEEFTGRTAD